MNYYVLEVMCGVWRSDSIQDVKPFRITWENPDTGKIVSKMFIGAVLETQLKNADLIDRISIGFHFYKYPKRFNFENVKKGERPKAISNVYIPSQDMSQLDYDEVEGWSDKIIDYAIRTLETDKNGDTITAIHPDEIVDDKK